MLQPIIKLRQKFDASIPVAGFILSIVGLVMVLSASQIEAASQYGNSYYFFTRQFFYWLAGCVAFFYFLRMPIDLLYENRMRLLYITVGLLIIVFIPYIGPEIAGVHRWIDLGIFRFQPSEIAKLFLVVFFSGMLASKGEAVSNLWRGFFPFILVLTVLTLMVVAEKDLGTTFIIVATSMLIYFCSQSKLRHFFAIILIGSVAFWGLIQLAPYRVSRLTGFLNRNNSTLDSAYHGQQALIAIGSGGLWGVGFGQGISKYQYLPESHTDSIFAVLAEELGFIRTSLVLLAFVFLTWRGMMVARMANSKFVQLLAVGLTSIFILQALVNIAGMLNLIPLTGVPLPFISYGGSSLIVSLAMLGLLTNISREVNE